MTLENFLLLKIVNIWNSLYIPNTAVEVDNVDKFKTRFDKFWMYQDIRPLNMN